MNFGGRGGGSPILVEFRLKNRVKISKNGGKRGRVAPFGPIFNQNEATGPRNIFRLLQGSKTAIFDLKTLKNTIFGKLGISGGLLPALNRAAPVWDAVAQGGVGGMGASLLMGRGRAQP